MVAKRQGASRYKAKVATPTASDAHADTAVENTEEGEIISSEEDYSSSEGSYTDEEMGEYDLEDLPEELLASLPPEALEALKSAQKTSAAPKVASSPAAVEEPEVTPIAPPQLPEKKKGKRRWDQVKSSATAAAEVGKRTYKSWRCHKNAILGCLLQSGGNVAFSRRYMLFHDGVLVPKNVIRYYNSYYR
uniref:L4-33K/L4-22K protein n=1 Tax=Rhinolophus ferrumequinum adenovirus TaxID=3140013 RepID=A0AAU6S545_9ADEN